MIGGGVGLMGAMGALKRSDLLKRAALTHKVKRGTMINTVVGRVRDRSGQFGSFGKLFLITLWRNLNTQIYVVEQKMFCKMKIKCRTVVSTNKFKIQNEELN